MCILNDIVTEKPNEDNYDIWKFQHRNISSKRGSLFSNNKRPLPPPQILLQTLFTNKNKKVRAIINLLFDNDKSSIL